MNILNDLGHGPTQVMHVSVTFGEDGQPLRLLHALSEDGIHVVCAAYSLHPAHGDERLDLPLAPERAASAVLDFARAANRRVVASDDETHTFLAGGWAADETVRLLSIQEFTAGLSDGSRFLDLIVRKPAHAGLAATAARAHLMSCGHGRPIIERTWEEARLLDGPYDQLRDE